MAGETVAESPEKYQAAIQDGQADEARVDSIATILRRSRLRLESTRYLGLLRNGWILAFAIGILIVLGDRFGWYAVAPIPLGLLLFIAGIVGAAVWLRLHPTPEVDIAGRVDQTFSLHDRLSTWVSLPPEQRTSGAGQALTDDVVHHLRPVDPNRGFPIQLPELAWLPLGVAAVFVIVATSLGPIRLPHSARQAVVTEEERAVVDAQTDKLLKKVEKARQEIEALGVEGDEAEWLGDLGELGKRLEENRGRSPQDAAREMAKAMDDLQRKRETLGPKDEVAKALGQLPLAPSGPARELSKALKAGDFNAARKEIDRMWQELRDENRDPQEKAELAQQLAKMEKQLEGLANQAQRAEQLKQNIPPELLKQELQKLAQDREKLEQLQKLAENMGEMARQMAEQADGADMQAGEGLEEAMQNMQQQLEEMRRDQQMADMMDDMARQLAEGRQMLLDGEQGDPFEGGMEGDGEGESPDGGGEPPDAPGGRQAGRGPGPRAPSPEIDTNTRKQRATAEMGLGRVRYAGKAPAANFPGRSHAEIRDAISEASSRAEDALTRQRVPADYQPHVQEYFEQLNQGMSTSP